MSPFIRVLLGPRGGPRLALNYSEVDVEPQQIQLQSTPLALEFSRKLRP